MIWRLIVGLVLLALGGVWSKSLIERYRANRSKALAEQVLDTLLGFGPEPLWALLCLVGGCALLFAAVTGYQNLTAS